MSGRAIRVHDGAVQPVAVRSPRLLSPRQTVLLTLCGIALVWQLWQWAIWISIRGSLDSYAKLIDFAATLTGARIIRDGDGTQLYDLAVQRVAQRQVVFPALLRPEALLPYIHPPYEALLFAPLADLSAGLLYALWIVGVLVALGLSLWLLIRTIVPSRATTVVLVVASLSYGALHQALSLGQSSPLILLGLCGTYAGLRSQRAGWAGVGLALLVLKPQMLLLIGVLLLLERRWKTLFVGGMVVGGASILAMPILGLPWPLRYARFLATMGDWTGGHNEYPTIMHNWRGLMVHLLAAAPQFVAPAVTVLSVIAIALLAWCWWPAHRASLTECADARRDLRWAAACLVAVLVAPHLYIHDLTILLLPAWLIVPQLLDGAWSVTATRLWWGLLWGSYALAFIFPFRLESFLAFPVVPHVLILATALALLLWHCCRDSARPRVAHLAS